MEANRHMLSDLNKTVGSSTSNGLLLRAAPGALEENDNEDNCIKQQTL
jgi:hypothetical protein